MEGRSSTPVHGWKKGRGLRIMQAGEGVASLKETKVDTRTAGQQVTGKVRCKSCNKLFKKANGLAGHVRAMHPEEIEGKDKGAWRAYAVPA